MLCEPVQRRGEKRALEDALNRLPEDYREMIWLRLR